MPAHAEPSTQERALLAWCAEATGGRVVHAAALAGGNRRRAWAVDVQGPEGAPRALFLRFASAPNAADDPYDLRREARIYHALADTGVCLPRIVAEHPALPAMLIERVAGESAYRTCADGPAKERIAQDFMQALQRLHRLDATALGLGPVGSAADHVREELKIWRAMYEGTGRPDPLLALACVWLDANVPDVSTTATVVHGDAGPGNFLFAEGRLASMIDWELWHLGDPVEDIAWLSMRSVLEPVPDFAQRVREYEQLAGAPLDRARLLYHRIFVTLRVAVIRHRALLDPSPDSDPGNSLVSRLLNRRLLVDALSQALQLPATPLVLPSVAPSPRTADYAYLLAQLRDAITPAVRDPLVTRHVKGMARVLKHLQQQDHLGAAFDAQACEDLTALLGLPVHDAEAGRLALAAALRDGRTPLRAALPCLQRQVARESVLGAGALGQLATRGFQTLDPITP